MAQNVFSSIQQMVSTMDTSPTLRLNVRSKLWDEDVLVEDTVLELKKQLQDLTGVSPDKVSLSLGGKVLSDGLVVSQTLKPGDELTCGSSLRGGTVESLYPDGCYDCFCNYGERCGGIFMWRFMLLPAYINCPYDCAFFCLRVQCCGDKAPEPAGADGKPKVKKVEATSNTGIFY